MLGLAAPAWAKCRKKSKSEMMVQVSPPQQSGRPGKTYRLIVRDVGRYTVAEETSGTDLPAFCPERHINYDGTFCLGIEPIAASGENANRFWEQVRSFLLCQQFADLHGRWPTGRWLSHGSAADWQLRAERLAEDAGLAERYRRALEFGLGKLAGPLPSSFPLRERTSRRRALIEALIETELRRREAERSFTQYFWAVGRRCCERMRHCPLRNAQNQATHSE